MSFKVETKSITSIRKDLGLEKQGLLQKFIDKTVSEALQPYVSKDTGVQEESIKVATVLGSGKVIVNVPYAEAQAYSQKIKKRVGKRGTRPWERMVSDKKETILNQVSEYARRLDNGK